MVLKDFGVCIDFGHAGGKNGLLDPGVVNGKVRECDIAMAYGTHGQKYFEQYGVPVTLTRTKPEQKELTLTGRVNIANNAKPQPKVFWSAHVNASSNGGHGIETFCFQKYGTDGAKTKGFRVAEIVHARIMKATNDYLAWKGQKPNTDLGIKEGKNGFGPGKNIYVL